jgi:3,4-dihydroxy 2-butanone 4-phosphate synthase/GTP cyclohydrolase II
MGKFIIVADDEDRENEGDLICAAQFATEESMAFLVRYSSGIVCTPMLQSRCDELNLPLMVSENTESQRTAFTVTVDYKHGTHTGVSAQDRMLTVKALANPAAQADDFLRPGHIFPLIYNEGGVMERPGHTEATIDFLRLARLEPVGVICELVNDDGTMKKWPELVTFSQEHDLVLTTIKDLIDYLKQN